MLNAANRPEPLVGHSECPTDRGVGALLPAELYAHRLAGLVNDEAPTFVSVLLTMSGAAREGCAMLRDVEWPCY